MCIFHRMPDFFGQHLSDQDPKRILPYRIRIILTYYSLKVPVTSSQLTLITQLPNEVSTNSLCVVCDKIISKDHSPRNKEPKLKERKEIKESNNSSKSSILGRRRRSCTVSEQNSENLQTHIHFQNVARILSMHKQTWGNLREEADVIT